MIPKYTEHDFTVSKDTGLLLCECEYCHNDFKTAKSNIKRALSGKHFAQFCSKSCASISKNPPVLVKCEQCGTEVYRTPSRIKDKTHTFCSNLCKNQYKNFKVDVSCAQCGTTLIRQRSRLQRSNGQFCSINCKRLYQTNKIDTTCGCCGKPLSKPQNKINDSKSGLIFCNKTCAGIYNAAHKTHGYNRTKLEVWLEIQLSILYPSLEIQYNHTNTINSELDIYIPSLKLAFELNGIFHYEPIFGVEKLKYIQNNDSRKMQACLERGIEFCSIDNSGMKYFTDAKAKVYLDIIVNIINEKKAVLSSL